jgi:hypothetical protein
MNFPRYCFGYCTFEQGRYIAVAGGALDRFFHTNTCELYDVLKDKWITLPNLNEAKYSAAVVCVKDKFLYTFDGSVASKTMNYNASSIKIEKLDIQE